MTVQIDIPYASNGYSSNKNGPLPPPKWAEDLDRSGHFETHLSFGHYANLDPAMEVTTQLESKDHLRFQQQRERGEKEQIYCDSKSWRFQNSSKIPHLLFLLKIMSFPFTWVIWGTWILGELLPASHAPKYLRDSSLLLLVVVFTALSLGSLTLYMSGKKFVHHIQITGFIVCAGIVFSMTGTLWRHDTLQIALWVGAFLYFMGAIGFDCVLGLYSRINTYDGSEFNRQDGMLRFKRRFRRLFVAPFEEFDPVLQVLPSGYGSHDYALWLHHRYTDNKVCLETKVHALGLDQPNALAFWDCLQRYMDITQPLPDLPVLEQSRHLDPVTAAYDAQTGRNPRRWRDLSEKDWLATGLKQLTQQLQQYPWQKQPCIIKARIDPSLSIEAYYRAQEAKGIHATPKSEDFDDVHRG